MAKIKAKATKKQREAFDKVIEAMQEAKKLGLRFYGLQYNLVAYTKEASEYQHHHGFEKLLSYHYTSHGDIPYLSEHILSDSGADDYPRFLKGDEAI